ncbi:hypothetical protein XIS1_1420004 [Xenorhabdus innexi]|uniref:Uncharacterized protein n=1 Tax=Xenorhabdus innexi TaxID=290109 RepID=A0A1N6MU46_9GAMM|nr:hypothetical protein XIS1_1420004 [Xenorhabdus innexi]
MFSLMISTVFQVISIIRFVRRGLDQFMLLHFQYQPQFKSTKVTIFCIFKLLFYCIYLFNQTNSDDSDLYS